MISQDNRQSRGKFDIGKRIINKRKYTIFDLEHIFLLCMIKMQFHSTPLRELLITQILCPDETNIQWHVLLHLFGQHIFLHLSYILGKFNFQFDFNI